MNFTGLLPIASDRLSWVHLIGCLTMKFAVTVAASSLLPWLDGMYMFPLTYGISNVSTNFGFIAVGGELIFSVLDFF